MNLLEKTKTNARNFKVALIVGIIGGLISGFVKSGTEGILPPRIPGRIAPPIQMIENMGINVKQMVYIYSDQIINWGGVVIHMGFSIIWAVIYCIIAEVYPKIKLGQGLLFGIVIAILFHGIMLPILQLSPVVWHLPSHEIFSEIVGTLLWMWTIEIVRRDLRNRMTKQPDPEFQ
jgi:putative membrane protein